MRSMLRIRNAIGSTVQSLCSYDASRRQAKASRDAALPQKRLTPSASETSSFLETVSSQISSLKRICGRRRLKR